MLFITEPLWGNHLLQTLNTWASSSPYIFQGVSFFADAPIFLLPLFLLIAYVIGIKKRNTKIKVAALRVLLSAGLAICINVVVQLFIIKNRPETVLSGQGRLLLKHLPTMSFPSDHAAVSMAFAIAVLFFFDRMGKGYKVLGWIFVVTSILMSVARVAVGVHWPTDIIVGWVAGVVAYYMAKSIPQKPITCFTHCEERITGLFVSKRK